MRFCKTPLAGAFVIELERREDERGFFARCWCQDEFAAHGIATAWVQSNVSFNRHAGTLRGLHYQAEPHGEDRLVRCTMGAAYDVLVDLRPGSPTCERWFAVELSAHNRRMVYIPRGLAHGFQTLVDRTELHYLMSTVFRPESARGVRWDDPGLGITWPYWPRRIISPRDQNYPDLMPCATS